jgi:hypothetical protein
MWENEKRPLAMDLAVLYFQHLKVMKNDAEGPEKYYNTRLTFYIKN